MEKIKPNKERLIGRLDIEIYDDFGEHTWAQAKYLAHGYDDVLWTNILDEAFSFLKVEVNKLWVRS